MRSNNLAHMPPRRVDPPPSAGRVPPHDLDAEGVVLSACLIDGNRHADGSPCALGRVLEILKPEHFYSDANARIFQAMQQLAIAMTPVDMSTVASWLRDRDWLQRIGGTAYLGRLADETPGVANVAAHAGNVHEKWRLRQLIATCQRVAAEGYGDVGEVQEFIDDAEKSVADIAAAKSSAIVGRVTVDLADDVMAQITESLTGRVSGTSWGWAPVDERVGLLMPSGYYVVPARSGHGKTQYATQTALNIAEAPPRDGFANYVYMGSFEMPCSVLLKRTICTEADVSFKRANAGDVSHERRFEFDGAECPGCGAAYRPETYATLAMAHGQKICADCFGPVVPAASEQERLKATANRIRQTTIIWDDRRCEPKELAARVRVAQEQAIAGKLVARNGTALPRGVVRAVVVDYIQKLPAPPGPNNRSRQREVAEISQGLVEHVAKGCKVAVIALAQINREVDKQKGARPTLADIREAGDIENDADEIIAIHREQYRLREKTPIEFQNIAEMIHLKGRGGLDAELAPARMWFTHGRFHSKPPDERMCAWHHAMWTQSRSDPVEANEVAIKSAACMRCYGASWDAWAERIGVRT